MANAEEWWRMVTNDGTWWRMVTHDGEWWRMMANAEEWWRMVTNDGTWWRMVTHDGEWWRMMANAEEWWRMVTNDGTWWRMVAHDSEWWRQNGDKFVLLQVDNFNSVIHCVNKALFTFLMTNAFIEELNRKTDILFGKAAHRKVPSSTLKTRQKTNMKCKVSERWS